MYKTKLQLKVSVGVYTQVFSITIMCQKLFDITYEIEEMEELKHQRWD